MVSVKLPVCYNGHFVDFTIMSQIVLLAFYCTIDVHLTCLNKDVLTYNGLPQHDEFSMRL